MKKKKIVLNTREDIFYERKKNQKFRCTMMLE